MYQLLQLPVRSLESVERIMRSGDSLAGPDSRDEVGLANPWGDGSLDIGSSAMGSQEGSPLIRAGRLQHFAGLENSMEENRDSRQIPLSAPPKFALVMAACKMTF